MIITKAFLYERVHDLNIANETNKNKVLFENKQIFFQKNTFDIFLSHSYLDKNLIYAIVNMFNYMGFSVYVDWIVDGELNRAQVNSKTATILRERMNDCRCLIYVSTENATNSKWCPWELGYVDGLTNGRCAILPIMENDTESFNGQEYLGLYPYISHGKNKYFGEHFIVNDSQNKFKFIDFKEWICGKNPYFHG